MSINKIWLKIILAFIPSKKVRNLLRQKLSNDKKCYQPTKFQDVKGNIIYTPIYNTSAQMLKGEWDIYNKSGKKLKPVYLRDFHCAHAEYIPSKYLYFDRFAYSLDTHFYSHQSLLEQCGNPSRKYAFFCESKGIVPDDYKIFEKNKGLEKDFNLIFTYNEKILDSFDNARFAPLSSMLWFGNNWGGGKIDPLLYQKKTKGISIISSDKEMCDLHKLRIDIARKCKNENLADTFGTFDGGNLCKIAETLTDYRFSIAIENEIEPYFFTEKITNCFAAMTIPVYIGATRIEEFFNPAGIIRVSLKDIHNLSKILSLCTEREYESRIEAIIDNFNRVQRYRNIWDMCVEDYLKDELQL